MTVVSVRVNPKTGLSSRCRAGVKFTTEWSDPTEVDNATLTALHGDPMLEVTEPPATDVSQTADTQTTDDGTALGDGAKTDTKVKAAAKVKAATAEADAEDAAAPTEQA